jgi:hypothetical protein
VSFDLIVEHAQVRLGDAETEVSEYTAECVVPFSPRLLEPVKTISSTSLPCPPGLRILVAAACRFLHPPLTQLFPVSYLLSPISTPLHQCL